MTPAAADADRPVRLPLTAAILAGGRSMRMGVDKTLLAVDGIPLVARVANAASECCAHSVVVTNRPDAIKEADLPDDVPVLTDEVAYQGPLGGLVTALSVAQDEWVLAVAADMPWLSPELIRALWERRDGADVVVPVTDKGPEPLLALYRVEPCLPAARAALASGRRRLIAIFGSVRVLDVPVESLRVADPELLSFVNVNTPDDLAEARDAAESAVPTAGAAPGAQGATAASTAAAPAIPPAAVAPEAPAQPRTHAEEPPRLSVIEVGTRRVRGMPSEQPITLYMNDVEVATVQATPKDLEEMAVGFLVAEGLMTDREAFVSVDADHKRGMVYVTTLESVPDDMVYKTRYVTSGCGKGVTFSSVGHARGLDKIASKVEVPAEQIYELMTEMSRHAEQYRDTGGTHACGLARDGELALVREDVGRHNALDKLLGRAWLDRVPTEDAVLLSTGRISYEMAVKAAKSRVPVVVSRTSVTDLAADIANDLGITLVGYARGGKLVVFTNSDRIRLPEEA